MSFPSGNPYPVQQTPWLFPQQIPQCPRDSSQQPPVNGDFTVPPQWRHPGYPPIIMVFPSITDPRAILNIVNQQRATFPNHPHGYPPPQPNLNHVPSMTIIPREPSANMSNPVIQQPQPIPIQSDPVAPILPKEPPPLITIDEEDNRDSGTATLSNSGTISSTQNNIFPEKHESSLVPSSQSDATDQDIFAEIKMSPESAESLHCTGRRKRMKLCARCRGHNLENPVKGHNCRFKTCVCTMCEHIKLRNDYQKQLRRSFN